MLRQGATGLLMEGSHWEGGWMVVFLEVSAKLECKRQGQVSQAWESKGKGNIKNKQKG